MLIATWANSTGGSPYSLSKAHLAPLVSDVHHSASRTLTTNQPSVTGVSPDPASSSRASCTGAILSENDDSCVSAESRSRRVRSQGGPIEVPAHVQRHLQQIDRRRADRPSRQADRGVQRPLHSDRGAALSRRA